MPVTEQRPTVESFSARVTQLRERVETLGLRARTSDITDLTLLQDALDELSTTTEELFVADEELKAQFDQILKTQDALVSERERYRSLFDEAPVAYVVTNMQGLILQANDLAAEMINISPEYVVGKPFLNYIAPAERREFRQELNRLQQVTRVYNLEATLKPRNRPQVDAVISIVVVYDSAQRPVALRWIIQDITERKRRQAEIERLNAELEQRVRERTRELEREKLEKELAYEQEREAHAEAERANQLKIQFLAMVSHELRTPLASIKGFASSLLADDVEWAEAMQREFISTIDQESDKLTDLIDQLLDLSRLKGGNLRIQPVQLSMHAVFDMASAQLDALSRTHKLTIDAPRDLPDVHADPGRISQVLTNLAGNAAKFAPDGTEITIRCEQRANRLCTIVSDQGPGIPDDMRQAVFEPFQQVSDSWSPRKGVGLGLAICKELVTAHGGNIWIEDSAGGGTTICFTLPVMRAEDAG